MSDLTLIMRLKSEFKAEPEPEAWGWAGLGWQGDTSSFYKIISTVRAYIVIQALVLL